jgi:hypothetical protein
MGKMERVNGFGYTSRSGALGAALVVGGLAALAAGCAFDGRIEIHYSEAAPVVVEETVQQAEQEPHHVHGLTSRRGQIAGVDCAVTVVYDANDLAGPGIFVQTKVVHLRTRRLPPGVAFDFDCSGPLIVQIPADASDVRAAATSGSGLPVPLPVRARVSSIQISSGRHLRAQPGTQLAVVAWPGTLSGGDYRLQLSLGLSAARPIREKVLYAASVTCGRSRYLQPIVPAVSRMRRVPGFTIRPSANAFSLSLPRIAGATESGVPVYATRRLSCAH